MSRLPGGGNFFPGLGFLPLGATHNVHRPLYRVGAAYRGGSAAYFRGKREVLRVGVVGSFGWCWCNCGMLVVWRWHLRLGRCPPWLRPRGLGLLQVPP